MKKINNYNVMIVEDELLLQKSVERHIREINPSFQVVCRASNGQEALDLLKETDVHLIISDIRMPIMSGLDLAKHVYEQYPHILMILLTGYADFNYAKEALRLSVVDYLLKPLDNAEFETALMHASILLQKNYELLENNTSGGMSQEEAVKYIKVYIREHFMEDIDFTDLAEKLGFSSAYLTKLFNKYMHDTPLKYLTDLRIKEAQHLLATTSLPIRMVGEQVGYPDQFYFSKIFRRVTGKNPTAYRKDLMAETTEPNTEDETL